MIREQPCEFVKLVAKLMPQSVRVNLEQEEIPYLIIEEPKLVEATQDSSLVEENKVLSLPSADRSH
jgi:hypothetical protein